MRLWDVPGRRLLRTFLGHEKPVWAVAFVPDGKHAVSGGYDTVIKVWELDTGRTVGNSH
jgi:WD40 repeat protein